MSTSTQLDVWQTTGLYTSWFVSKSYEYKNNVRVKAPFFIQW
jgi:hypothetical protein